MPWRCSLLLVLVLAPAQAGCITLGLGSGLAVTPASADAAVAPTFGVDLGVAIELPHHVRDSRPPAPRTVRIAAGFGSSMTGLSTDQGAVNAMTGPIFLRTDVTFLHLGPRALLRATARVEAPGWDLERDPIGAVGPYDVPHSTAIGALAGLTLELPTERSVALLVTAGLRMHSFAGDQLESTLLFGPEIAIAADIDVMRVFAGARQ